METPFSTAFFMEFHAVAMILNAYRARGMPYFTIVIETFFPKNMSFIFIFNVKF